MVTPPHRSPRDGCAPPIVIEIPHATVLRLRPEVAARDVPVKRLISNLLDVIGEEPDLVRALLDDGDLPRA